jgi:hypothetical protein
LSHDFEDELTREGFVAETFFEFGEDFLMRGVFMVKDRREGSVFRTWLLERRIGGV